MKEINDLFQCILGLFLTGHIRKGDAGLGFRINLCIGLAECHRISGAAHLLHQRTPHQLSDSDKKNQRQNPGQQEIEKRRSLCINLRTVFYIFSIKQLIQVYPRNLPSLVGDIPGLVFIVIFQRIDDLIVRRHIHLIDIILFQLFTELVKPHFLRPIHHGWEEENV